MKKHAYLIIAHKNVEQIQTLLNSLDFEDNDIYMMIDKKSDINDDSLKTYSSNLFFVDRIDVRWGSDSLINAELILFKKAYLSSSNYDYYHLISGQDYPLDNQNNIQKFFDENPGKEFITFSAMSDQKSLSLRLHKYFFSNDFRTKNVLIKIIHKSLRLFYGLLFRLKKNNKIYFGSEWCSVDTEFVKYLVDNELVIKKRFFNGFLADEVYKQQIIMENRRFRDKLYYPDAVHDLSEEFQGNLRYINWWDGSPYTWTKDDINSLVSARDNGHLFSRKFDYKVDKEIISMINEKLINRK